MKSMNSLLLGSAAGLIITVGAQAADLPVKAKPVEYVKICSLYGVGFYYIPGTDMCLKVGGWVRAEYTWGASGNIGTGAFQTINVNNRTTNNSTWRARGYITADARSQTEYGTVRSYIAVGVSGSDVNGAGNTFDANRAFIQWAGFTFGQAQSFYDFYSVPATSYWGTFPASDTGDPGWKVLGYTAQLGNGFSATIAAEMRRTVSSGLFNQTGLLNYGGFQAPDIVGNLRVDQAWGSAQIMAAAHQVNPLYYGLLENTGHPDDKWGFAVGAGIKLNAPMLGQGDFFQAQVNYTQGALRYVFFATQTSWFYREGDSVGIGAILDGVYGGVLGTTATAVELTTAWNVNAAYEHFWNPRWKTSVYGGYAQVNYNETANAMLCSSNVFGVGTGTGIGSLAVANPGCNQDWSTWWVGTRTQWNVTKDFYMGLDILYNKLNSATASSGFFTGNIANIPGPIRVDDQDNWQFRFRVHRDFYP
ncbi:MAG TPA: porin [Pseudolabrys sp.]